MSLCLQSVYCLIPFFVYLCMSLFLHLLFPSLCMYLFTCYVSRCLCMDVWIEVCISLCSYVICSSSVIQLRRSVFIQLVRYCCVCVVRSAVMSVLHDSVCHLAPYVVLDVCSCCFMYFVISVVISLDRYFFSLPVSVCRSLFSSFVSSVLLYGCRCVFSSFVSSVVCLYLVSQFVMYVRRSVWSYFFMFVVRY